MSATRASGPKPHVCSSAGHISYVRVALASVWQLHFPSLQTREERDRASADRVCQGISPGVRHLDRSRAPARPSRPIHSLNCAPCTNMPCNTARNLTVTASIDLTVNLQNG